MSTPAIYQLDVGITRFPVCLWSALFTELPLFPPSRQTMILFSFVSLFSAIFPVISLCYCIWLYNWLTVFLRREWQYTTLCSEEEYCVRQDTNSTLCRVTMVTTVITMVTTKLCSLVTPDTSPWFRRSGPTLPSSSSTSVSTHFTRFISWLSGAVVWSPPLNREVECSNLSATLLRVAGSSQQF